MTGKDFKQNPSGAFAYTGKTVESAGLIPGITPTKSAQDEISIIINTGTAGKLFNQSS